MLPIVLVENIESLSSRRAVSGLPGCAGRQPDLFRTRDWERIRQMPAFAL